MNQRIVSSSVKFGGVHRLHAAVEAQDEIVKVQAKPQAVGDGNLSVERVPVEESVLHAGVGASVPDVARVNEECAVEFPEKEGAPLCAEVQFEVARLVDEVHSATLSAVGSRTEFAHAPSSDTVCAAREVAFLVGKNV